MATQAWPAAVLLLSPFQSILSLISIIKSVTFILGISHECTDYSTKLIATHFLIWLQSHHINCSSCLHVSRSLFWPYVFQCLCRIKSESSIIEITNFTLFGSVHLNFLMLHHWHASPSLWHLILWIYVIPVILSFYFLCFFIDSLLLILSLLFYLFILI